MNLKKTPNSLEKNPLKILQSTVFKPFEKSNVIFLNLRSSQLEFIHKGEPCCSS